MLASSQQHCQILQELGGEGQALSSFRTLPDEPSRARGQGGPPERGGDLGLHGGPAAGAAAPARARPRAHGHQAREHLHRDGRHLQVGRLRTHD